MGFNGIYPLVNVYKKLMGKSPFYSWVNQIHYFDWVIFNSYVKLPEGTHLGMVQNPPIYGDLGDGLLF